MEVFKYKKNILTLILIIGSCRSDTDMDHPSDLRCQERLPMLTDSQDTETGYYIYGWQSF